MCQQGNILRVNQALRLDGKDAATAVQTSDLEQRVGPSG